MKDRVSVWMILLLSGLAIHSLVDEFLRPKYGIGEGVIQLILGVAPNFLPSGLIFPFGVLAFREYFIKIDKKRNTNNLNKWFWIGLLSSQIGLIAWEFMQKTGNLTFDNNDLFATILGGLMAIGIYFQFRPKYVKD